MQQTISYQGEAFSPASFASQPWPKASNATKAADVLKAWIGGDGLIPFYSSGTTQASKTMPAARAHIVASALATKAALGLFEHGTTLVCLDVDFTGGRMALLRSFIYGYDITIIEPVADPFTSLSQPATLISLVPYQCAAILQNKDSKKLLAQSGTVLIGGGQLDAGLEQALTLLWPVRMYHTFGMTETLSHIALRRIGKESAYQALPGVLVETDDIGRLRIKGPQTANAWLQTNDIVDLKGNAFIWLGRADNVINSGGIKIYPESLELQLGTILQSAGFNGAFYLTHQADALLGQKLILALEGQLGDIDTHALLKAAKAKLGSKYAPKTIIVQPQFARTPSGKIKRETF